MLLQLLQHKHFAWILIASILTPFVSFMESYIFNDWEFLKYLMILMVLDTITGLAKYFKLQTVSSRAFAKIFTKLIVYACVLTLTHVITHFKVQGTENIVFGWFDDFAYSALIVREGISILENFGVLCPRMVPKILLGKLKEFDNNGTFKKN